LFYLFASFAGVGGLSVVLAAANGPAAKLLYVVGCLAVSIWARNRNSWDYLLLTFWVAVFTPFFGRLVDMKAGWDASNLMLAASYVVALPMLPTVLRCLRSLEPHNVLFPALAGLCMIYGFVVSLLRGEFAPGLIGLSDWSVPLLYYFFIVSNGGQIESLVERLPRFVAANLLLLSMYGIWQFVAPPAWDRLWLASVDATSFGSPEPFMVRVFSTLNAPGIFATWIMALLVLSLGFRYRLTPLAQLAGTIALALTVVRTAWAALAIAIIFIILSGGRRGLRYACYVGIAALAAVVAISAFPELSDVVSARFDTFGNLQNDGSALERLDTARKVLVLIDENPLGLGVGAFGRGAIAAKSVAFEGAVDNGILEIFASLGWLVGAIYCAALIGTSATLILRRSLMAPARVTLAAGIACLCELPIANVVSFPGVVMWTMFALTSAIATTALGTNRTRSTGTAAIGHRAAVEPFIST
jgi:O-Antigen ligase